MVFTKCPACKCKHRIDKKVVGAPIVCQKCNNTFKVVKTHEKKRIPNLVELALSYQLISKEQLAKALTIQKEQKKNGKDLPVKDILIEKGMINQEKMNMIQDIRKYLEARNLDQKFGKIAVNKGILSEKEIQLALSMQLKTFKKNKCCRLIGDILVEAKLINEQQRDAILKEQKRFDRTLPSQEGVQDVGLKAWYSGIKEEVAEEGIINFLLAFLQKRAVPVIIGICLLTGCFIFYASISKPRNYKSAYSESLVSRIFNLGLKEYTYEFAFSTTLMDKSFFSVEMDVIFIGREGLMEIAKKEDKIQHAFTIVFNPRVASQIKTKKKLPITLKKIFKSQLDNKVKDIHITKYVLTKR